MPASCPTPGWARVAHVLGVTALLASAKKCFVLVFLKKYLFHLFLALSALGCDTWIFVAACAL